MFKNKGNHKEITKIIKEYVHLLEKKKFPIKDVYLYGSYAKGTQTPLSDIDICIITDNDHKDKEDKENFLWRSVLEVDPRIEPAFYFSDDFNIVDPLVFEIKKFGIKISTL